MPKLLACPFYQTLCFRYTIYVDIRSVFLSLWHSLSLSLGIPLSPLPPLISLPAAPFSAALALQLTHIPLLRAAQPTPCLPHLSHCHRFFGWKALHHCALFARESPLEKNKYHILDFILFINFIFHLITYLKYCRLSLKSQKCEY